MRGRLLQSPSPESSEESGSESERQGNGLVANAEQSPGGNRRSATWRRNEDHADQVQTHEAYLEKASGSEDAADSSSSTGVSKLPAATGASTSTVTPALPHSTAGSTGMDSAHLQHLIPDLSSSDHLAAGQVPLGTFFPHGDVQAAAEALEGHELPEVKRVNVNIMVAGMSGLGKTTCIRNMLDPDGRLSAHDGASTSLQDFKSDLDYLRTKTDPVYRKDKGCVVTYTMQDTPGWGDQADIELSISAITSHVEARKAKEMQLWRGCFYQADQVEYEHMLDACLYFIPPHRFTEIDARFIQELSSKVTVIPVIAKADSMTSAETLNFKQEVAATLAGLSGTDGQSLMYDFDGKTLELNKDNPALGAVPPFAVIGSSTTREGQPIRVYPWGTCEGGNEAHSDFAKLRGLLLNSGMRGLRLRRHRFYVSHAAQYLIRQATHDTEAAYVAANKHAKEAETSVSMTGSSRRDVAQKAADESKAAAQMAQAEANKVFTAAEQVAKLLADSVHDVKQLQDTLGHARSAAKRAMEYKEVAAGQAQRALDQISPRNTRSRLRVPWNRPDTRPPAGRDSTT